MSDQAQINQIMKNFYLYLFEYSGKGIQNTYRNLKPSIFPFPKIKDTYIAYGLDSVKISERDFSFAFLDYQTSEPLLFDVMTLLHKFGYKSEFFDCDQFAAAMTILMGLFYGINTCGNCWGIVYDKQTGKEISPHFFNMPITYDPIYKRFELWLCDPLNPGIVKIEKGKPIILNSWEYRSLNNADYR